MICPGYLSPQFFFYTDQIPPLIYYSHLSMIFSLIVGFFVYYKNRTLASKILFWLSLSFLSWSLLDLVNWTNNNSNTIMFAWSLLLFFYIAIHVLCLYFVYVFIEKQDVSFSKKIAFFALLLPAFIFTPTAYNLRGFDLNLCGAAGLEGEYLSYFKLIFGVFIFVWILFLAIRKYKNTDAKDKKQIILFISGIELLILVLFITEFIASYLADNAIVTDFSITQYGFFAMTFFMGVLSYIIVRFKAFNIKLIATEALVWGLSILIGSQFFFIRTTTNRILNSFTFISSIIFGYFLTRSVKIEIQQKEELAKLNVDLKDLIKQRESLVHLITHKVKGSFTRTKVLFAGILDGSFGETTPEIKKRAQQGLEFDDNGIQTVDLVLNVANMQNGTVRYEMKNFDFKDLVQKTISEKEIQAEDKGLKIETEIKDGSYNVLGDAIWLKEVVNNLIDNSIKYTKEGKITVGLEDGDGKVKLYVKDTGMGITDEDKKNLFTEGGRGRDSIRVNVDSTGYGLYTVKLITEAHQGKVWVDSEPGKGSTFYIELPKVTS